MCTAVTAQSRTGHTYFGRTMDFSYPLDPELYIVPKGYTWNNMPNTHRIQNRYRFMGIGQDISPIIFADGVNEMGFAAAVLYFPGYAHYDQNDSDDPSKLPVAAVELVNFLLGQCASVEHAASILKLIRITGVKDSVTNSVAPLHWIAADKSGKCLIIEKMSDGLHMMDNPIGVFSNSPDFQWHLTNLRSYMNAAPAQNPEADWDSVTLTPFGQGAGTFGLPGDYTPPSRFVKTAYLKSHTPIPDDKEQAVVTCFHLLENVSIPKGAVTTQRSTDDYTQYTAFISLSDREYFFRTYDNSQITSAKLISDRSPGSVIKSLGKLNRLITFESRTAGL